MLTGWHPKFELERGLANLEKTERLALGVRGDLHPDDSTSLVSLNSTYAEFVDRTFSMKGFIPTLVTGTFSFLCVVIAIYAVVSVFPASPTWADFLAIFLFILLMGGLVLFFWNLVLKYDFFAYRYYPVRFNRLTRKIHIFRNNGAAGEVVVPWGSNRLFFFVGWGTQNKSLCDLRCHILNRNGIITDTFTVGTFTDDPMRVRGRWEFINRYMEGGPDHAVSHESDRVITLSMKNSFKNSYRWTCFLLGRSLFPLRYILFPWYGVLALTRWLVMATCVAPRFSPVTIAESRFDPDDKGRWEEPDYIDQFGERPDVVARMRELHRERQRRSGAPDHQ